MSRKQNVPHGDAVKNPLKKWSEQACALPDHLTALIKEADKQAAGRGAAVKAVRS